MGIIKTNKALRMSRCSAITLSGNPFRVISDAIDIINNGDIRLVIITKTNNIQILADKLNDNYYYFIDENISNPLNKQNLMKYLLNKSDIFSVDIYGSIGIYYINEIWYYTNIQANTIQKAWKQYRIRTARTRNDLVLKGLSEYWFHPSRILFEIE